MRKALILALAVVAVGCSSSHKKDDSKDTKATGAAADMAKGSKDKKAATTSTPDSGDAMKVTCKNKGDERIIEVRPKDKGCELGYTKGGNETIVATSNSGNDHCNKVQGRIQENLKAAGFTCD